MSDFLQRAALLYLSKAPESAVNTPVTAGASYVRIVNDNPVVLIPSLEKRNNQGRGGSEFASAAPCNTYWSPPALAINADADFDAACRLWLRAAGGPIVDTTVVALLAGKHTCPMRSTATDSQLPASTVVSVIEGSGA